MSKESEMTGITTLLAKFPKNKVPDIYVINGIDPETLEPVVNYRIYFSYMPEGGYLFTQQYPDTEQAKIFAVNDWGKVTHYDDKVVIPTTLGKLDGMVVEARAGYRVTKAHVDDSEDYAQRDVENIIREFYRCHILYVPKFKLVCHGL